MTDYNYEKEDLRFVTAQGLKENLSIALQTRVSYSKNYLVVQLKWNNEVISEDFITFNELSDLM